MSHQTVAALCDVMFQYTHTNAHMHTAAIKCVPATPPPTQDVRRTHGVQQDGEEELPAVDELVQLVGAAGVVLVEDGVSEEAARLPGQHLPQRIYIYTSSNPKGQ